MLFQKHTGIRLFRAQKAPSAPYGATIWALKVPYKTATSPIFLVARPQDSLTEWKGICVTRGHVTNAICKSMLFVLCRCNALADARPVTYPRRRPSEVRRRGAARCARNKAFTGHSQGYGVPFPEVNDVNALPKGVGLWVGRNGACRTVCRFSQLKFRSQSSAPPSPFHGNGL